MFSKLYAILSPEGKRRLPSMLALFVFVALVEVTSVISVLPFIAVVSQPQQVARPGLVHNVYQWLNFHDPTQFIWFLGWMTLSVILLGNATSAFATYWSLDYMAQEHTRLARRLLERFFSSHYSWFLTRNSADLGHKIMIEVQTVVNGVLLTSMRMFSKAIVVGLIMLSLVAVNPKIACSTAIVLVGTYVALYKLFRPRLIQIGSRRNVLEKTRNRVVRESLSGIKSTILFGKEKFFQDCFEDWTQTSSRLQTQQISMNELPRNLLEAMTFSGVVAVILYYIRNGQDITGFLPTLSVFAVGAYRMLPALQQTFSYLTVMKSSSPALDSIYAELTEKRERKISSPESVEPLPLSDSIKLESINFSYSSSDRPVLHDIGLEIPQNTTVALVGQTGSGKSTTLDILLGLLEPQSGRMLIDGEVLARDQILRWQRSIGYVAQDIFLLDDTLRANIAFGLHTSDVDEGSVERAARLANIHEFIVGLPDGYDTRVGERGVRLSGGQRQRIGIARALYRDPAVLILDEATSSLDGVTEQAVMAAVGSLNHQKTILIVAHRLATVRQCDKIYVLSQGRIVDCGTYDSLNATSAAFRALAQSSQPEETAAS